MNLSNYSARTDVQDTDNFTGYRGTAHVGLVRPESRWTGAVLRTWVGASFPQVVATIAALKAIVTTGLVTGRTVKVLAYATAGDGGGGTFRFNSASAVADNGGTIFAPTSGSGRWYRNYSGNMNARWFGATGDGTTDDYAAAQLAVTAVPTRGVLLFPEGNYKLSADLSVANKTSVRITGSGRLFLSGALTGAMIFNLSGTIAGLEIDGLELVGDNNTGYTQAAIGNLSGQTISSVNFHDLTISNINVGISLNAHLSGTYTNGRVHHNRLSNILGTVSGSGYGIHLAKANNVIVEANTIDGATRHSIYQAFGVDCHNIITHNIITNHRIGVADGAFRCAIVVSRSSYVTVSGNHIIDGYDGGMEISHVTSDTVNCTNIIVTGNQFIGRKNLVPYILVGEQAVPTSYLTSDVSITDNGFYEDVAVSLGGVCITILNGQRIKISGNRQRRVNVGVDVAQFALLGSSTYATADAHIGDITVTGNDLYCDVQAAGSSPFYVSTRLCTGASPYTIKDNVLKNYESNFTFQATPVNVNSRLKFRTSMVIDLASIPANTLFVGAYTLEGVKTTSQVSGRPEYAILNSLAYNFMAKSDAVNAIAITVGNVTVGAHDAASQTFLIFVEDF